MFTLVCVKRSLYAVLAEKYWTARSVERWPYFTESHCGRVVPVTISNLNRQMRNLKEHV